MLAHEDFHSFLLLRMMGGTRIAAVQARVHHDSKMTHGWFMKALLEFDVNSAGTDDP